MSINNLFANRKDRTLYVHDGAANYIVAYIFQIILQLLFTIVLIATMTIEDRNAFSNTPLYIYIIAIINELSIGLTPLSYSKVLGQNYYKDMGFTKKINVLQVLLLVVIAILVVCAFAPLATYVKEFFEKTGFDLTSITSLTVKNPGELIGGIILLALVPAILEETLYRGMIARAFTRKSYVFAIFMGGFMFAIMHGNPLQLVHQFFLGCVCCIVYFASGSIYASIIVHFTNNLIAVVGSYIVYYHPFTIPTLAFVLMMVFGILLLIVALYFFIKLSNKNASIKNGFRAFESTFRECFEKKDKVDEKQIEIDAAVKESGLEEINEIYEQTKKNITADEKLKGRRAMIFAIVLALFVLAVNIASGYMN